jgi:hypothetical protein
MQRTGQVILKKGGSSANRLNPSQKGAKKNRMHLHPVSIDWHSGTGKKYLPPTTTTNGVKPVAPEMPRLLIYIVM